MQNVKKVAIIAVAIIILGVGVLYYSLSQRNGSGKGTDDFSAADPEMRAILDEGQPGAPYKETSVDKIDADFAANKISMEKYALLSIAAIYHPEDLPEQYSGEADIEFDHAFLYGLINQNWNSFSEDAKAALLPFVLPADNPKSYFNEAANEENSKSIWEKLFGATKASAAGDTEKLDVDSKTSVAYNKNASAQVKERADWMRLAAAIAIPKFKELLSIEPQIIIIRPTSARLIGRAYGDAEYLTGPPAYCEVRVRDNLDFVKTSATTAHEIFHCFQYFYGFKYQKPDMKWFMEATATWSEDFAFPNQGTEHEYDDDFLDHMPWDMLSYRDNRHYGSYLWFFYMTQKFGPENVAYAFQRVKETNEPREALNTFPAFADNFKEFILWDWNYKPYQYYQDTPQFPNIHPNGESRAQKMIKAAGNYPAEVALSKGAAKYYIYGFAGDKAKLIKFDLEGMGIDNENKTTAIQALYKVNDNWYYEDWSNINERTFCRDLDGENIDGVVVMVSNSNLKQSVFGEYNLEVKNKCGSGWRGTIRVQWNMRQNLNPTGTWRIAEKGSYNITEELEYDSERDSLDIKTSTFSVNYSSSQIIQGKSTDCVPFEGSGSNISGGATYIYTKNNSPDEGHLPSRFYGTDTLEEGKFGGTYSLGFNLPEPPAGRTNPLRGTRWGKKTAGDCPNYILGLPNLFDQNINTVEEIENPTIYEVNAVDIYADPKTKRIRGSDKFEIHTGVWGTVDWDYQKID